MKASEGENKGGMSILLKVGVADLNQSLHDNQVLKDFYVLGHFWMKLEVFSERVGQDTTTVNYVIPLSMLSMLSAFC